MNGTILLTTFYGNVETEFFQYRFNWICIVFSIVLGNSEWHSICRLLFQAIAGFFVVLTVCLPGRVLERKNATVVFTPFIPQ